MKITTMNHDYDLCNTYLVEFDSFSIVIDPSIPYDNLEDDFKNKLKYVLITHFHYDHVAYLNTYFNHSITFYMHKNALDKANDKKKNVSYLFGKDLNINFNNEKLELISDSAILKINNIEIKTFDLFGHTNCSVAFLIDNNLFIGDVLFNGSIGALHFYSGNQLEMQKSIEKIKTMPDYFVYPGHGPSTKISIEKKNNPFLNGYKFY